MFIDNQFLKERFGISYLRPYQELIISYIMESAEGKAKGDVLGLLPTGSGKSLCFMYPIAKLGCRSVLIYPLLSLMNDQAKRFEKAGIPYEIMRGGLERSERLKRICHIKGDPSVSVITNIETLIAMDEREELKALCTKPLIVVVDEAHTAPMWGESFRESYKRIGEIIEKLKPVMTLAFTATADEAICRGMEKYIFSGRKPYIVHGSSDRENIFYHSVKSLSKLHDIIRILTPESARPAIIFCRSRHLTEEIAKKLQRSFEIKHYHAALPRKEKEEKERWFHSSSCGVLASTSAYGMGVDKKDIRTVIHCSLPDDAASFMQESGRGGRDGERMDSYVLYYENETSPISDIFRSGRCIRYSLLRAMGEEREEKMCLSCSSCVPSGYLRAGEKEILSYIRLHPFFRKENVAAALTSRHIFFRSHRLWKWNEEDAAKAIDRLIQERKVKVIFHHLIKARHEKTRGSI